MADTKRDLGWLWHAFATAFVVLNTAFWVGREALQNGGISGMGSHSWAEALVPSLVGFVGMLVLVIVLDVVRASKEKP